MKNRIIALFITLIIALSCVTFAGAAKTSDSPETVKTTASESKASPEKTLSNLPSPSSDIEKGEGFTGKYPHIMDTANLLSKKEVASLEEKLSQLSEKWKLELVVVTTQDCENFEVSDYAELIFTACDYGYGKSKDGILLLISMEERDWYIATHGYGMDILSSWRVEYVGEEITPYLSSGDYADAFSTFADECADYADMVKNGYDISNGDHDRAPLSPIVLPICFVFGLIVALIVVSGMKRKLKTAVRQKEANNYIKDGSFHVTESSDQFLYNTVTRTPIAKNDNSHSSSSGGGGGSSSGSSFGGGGGKF